MLVPLLREYALSARRSSRPVRAGTVLFSMTSFGRTRFGGDLPSDVVDGGEIGFAVFFGRRADANENRVALAEGFAGVGGVRNFAGFARRFQHLIQVMLVDRNFAGIEFRDPIRINVRANNVVACLSQAGAGDQAYVTTTNDTKIQGASPR